MGAHGEGGPEIQDEQRAPAHARLAGGTAAALWVLLSVVWFDAAEPWRPAGLRELPPAPLAAGTLAALGVWLHARRRALWPDPAGLAGAALAAALALAFRLPLAVHAAAGYTTADASMAGLMALRIRDGVEHFVFIPNLVYCGSLKSHLAAPLMAVLDPARAFALVSAGFYALFAAAVHRLGWLAGGGRVALASGLYAAFAPTYVTQYSLSNDGNYVELLALGAWALLLAVQWLRAERQRPALALTAGLLLGAGFWCHVLGVVHTLAVGAILAIGGGARAALRSAPALAGGFALGAFPALLWNAGHGFSTFRYLLPAEYRGAAAPADAASDLGLGERALALLTDHGPILFGYDPGYPAVVDTLGLALAGLGLAVALSAAAIALRDAWRRRALEAGAALALFGLVDVAVVTAALPHVPGNPRYLLFAFTAAAVLVPGLLDRGRRPRLLLALLVAFGALGSLGQALAKMQQDQEWRGFLVGLERLGIQRCHSDYYTAARITFFSGERIICSSRVGPTWTDYFELYRAVDPAANPALVAPNAARADKLLRKLERLGVAARRIDLLRPVVLPERPVDPRLLFPQQPSG